MNIPFVQLLFSDDNVNRQTVQIVHNVAMHALNNVELAPSDLVFCAGGVAAASYLVLEGSLNYFQNDQKRVLKDGAWIADMCLWTPWLYLGDLVADDACRMISVEVTAFCAAIGSVWETRKLAAEFAEEFVANLNKLSTLSDVQETDEALSVPRSVPSARPGQRKTWHGFSKLFGERRMKDMSRQVAPDQQR